MISVTKCINLKSLNISRHYSRLTKKDPGINRRKAVVSSTEMHEFGDSELDDLEADFMGAHKSYKDHIKEMDAKNEQLKYQIVKQKYFKKKFPNFLTWHDKEQMRFLYNKDPEEWSIEKLSDSFPALPEIVKKILKSKFSKSESRIKNHDSNVEDNWANFKQGKYENLPPDLVEHLKKFTTRKLNTHNSTKKSEFINNPNIQSDFSEIITSYEKLKNKNSETKLHIMSTNKKPDTDTYLLVDKHKMKNEMITTLTQLQNEIKDKSSKGHNLTEEEKIIYADISQPKEGSLALNQVDVTAIMDNKYNATTGSSLIKKTIRDYSHLIYPEKIVIPKELKKPGYTYRLNDCYYDFDGQFLYRVPGMG